MDHQAAKYRKLTAIRLAVACHSLALYPIQEITPGTQLSTPPTKELTLPTLQLTPPQRLDCPYHD